MHVTHAPEDSSPSQSEYIRGAFWAELQASEPLYERLAAGGKIDKITWTEVAGSALRSRRTECPE